MLHACLCPACCTAALYVGSNLLSAVQVVPEVPYFATKVLLGSDGASKVLGLGNLNDFEKDALQAMLPELKAQIQKGIEFANKPAAAPAAAKA